MNGCKHSVTWTRSGATSFEHDGVLMIMTNPEHLTSDDAMKNNLASPREDSSLNTPLYLWNHLFADQRGSNVAIWRYSQEPEHLTLGSCWSALNATSPGLMKPVLRSSPPLASRIGAGRVTSAPTCLPRSAGLRRTLHPCAPFMWTVMGRIRARGSLNSPRSSNPHQNTRKCGGV